MMNWRIFLLVLLLTSTIAIAAYRDLIFGTLQWALTYSLEHTEDLAGRTLDLHLEDGSIIRHVFHADGKLEWTALSGNYADSSGPGSDIETYRATSVRDGIYVVAFIKNSNFRQMVDLILDFNRGIATAAVINLPARRTFLRSAYERRKAGEPQTSISVSFLAGAIDTVFTSRSARHNRTGELVGRRLKIDYSPTITYEHIYLTPHLYTWHGLRGWETGGADTEEMHYLKVDEDLFFLVWSEKTQPSTGQVLLDFKSQRVDGRFFDYVDTDGDAPFTESSTFPMGGYLTVLNQTEWDAD